MSRRICGHSRDVVQQGRVTGSAPHKEVRKTAALYTKAQQRRAKTAEIRAQFKCTGRHPAATASLSVQNQRSPFPVSIRTLPYQGLHGMW